MAEEVAEEYLSSLSDLTLNSKPLISMLTMLADDNKQHASVIVKAIEEHLQKVSHDIKLPVLYLIDSIVKNVRENYIQLFTQNIVSTFCSVFEQVDERTRAQMFKLRQTWNDVFPERKLYAIDIRVQAIDPAWPVTAPVPTQKGPSIHVNPLFFAKDSNPEPVVARSGVDFSTPSATKVTGGRIAKVKQQASQPQFVSSEIPSTPPSEPETKPFQSQSAALANMDLDDDSQSVNEAKMRSELLKKRKELLDLQQKKLELELIEAKARLEEQIRSDKAKSVQLKVEESSPIVTSVPSKVAAHSKSVKEKKKDPVTSPAIRPIVKHQLATAKPQSSGSSAKSQSSGSKMPSQGTVAAIKPNLQVTSMSFEDPSKSSIKSEKNTKSRDPRLRLSNLRNTAIVQPQPNVDAKTKQTAKDLTSSKVHKDPRLQNKDPRLSKHSIGSVKSLNVSQQTVSQSKEKLRGSSPVQKGVSPVIASQSTSPTGKKSSPNSSKSGNKTSPFRSRTSSPSKFALSSTKASSSNKPSPTKSKTESLLAKSDTTVNPQISAASSVKINELGVPVNKTEHEVVVGGVNTWEPKQSVPKLDNTPTKVDVQKLLKIEGHESRSNLDKPDTHKPKLSHKKNMGLFDTPEIEGVKSSVKKKDSSKSGSRSVKSEDSRKGSEKRKKDRRKENKVPEAKQTEEKVKSETKVRSSRETKGSKSRNFVQKIKEDRESPDSPSAEDIDFRHGPPEKLRRLNLVEENSREEISVGTKGSSVSEEKLPEKPSIIADETSRDLDFRHLSRSSSPPAVAKKRPSVETADQPPPKKTKEDSFQELFGSEDVDLRQFAPPAASLLAAQKAGGWARYKESNPDMYKSPLRPSWQLFEGSQGQGPVAQVLTGEQSPLARPLSPTENKENIKDKPIKQFKDPDRSPVDPLGRPRLFSRLPDDPGERRRSLSHARPDGTGEDTDMRYIADQDSGEEYGEGIIREIISQAEEQLRSGQLTFEQMKTLMKEVVHINEAKKLREAQRLEAQGSERERERVEDEKPDALTVARVRLAAIDPETGLPRSCAKREVEAKVPEVKEELSKIPKEEGSNASEFESEAKIILEVKEESSKAPECREETRRVVELKEEPNSIGESALILEWKGEPDKMEKGEISSDGAKTEDILKPFSPEREDKQLPEKGLAFPLGPPVKAEETFGPHGDIDERIVPPHKILPPHSIPVAVPPAGVQLPSAAHGLSGSGLPGQLPHQLQGSQMLHPSGMQPPQQILMGVPGPATTMHSDTPGLMPGDLLRGPVLPGGPQQPWEDVHRPFDRETGSWSSQPPLGPPVSLPSQVSLHGSMAHLPPHIPMNLPPPPHGMPVPPMMGRGMVRPPPMGARPYHPSFGPPPIIRSDSSQQFSMDKPFNWRPRFDGDDKMHRKFFDVRFNLPFKSLDQELPPADPSDLMEIERDSMKTINIDNIPREIRFYGDTAVIMMNWDDPREVSFQAGSQHRVIFNKRENFMCTIGDNYKEFVIGGKRHSIKLGAPTRELYVNGKWYECYFGGAEITIELNRKPHIVKLDGPAPVVKIGVDKRTDLVAGKINLIIDAREIVPVFLDAKLQKFEIEGKEHMLRFVEALRAVVINGRRFTVDYGGLPMPIIVHGRKHFIRFSALPRDVRPGYISIVNMEGGRLPSPPPDEGPVDSSDVNYDDEKHDHIPEKSQMAIGHEPVLPMIGSTAARRGKRNFGPGRNSPQAGDSEQSHNSSHIGDMLHKGSKFQRRGTPQLPLELLSSLMPAAVAPASGFSYKVHQDIETKKSQNTGNFSNVKKGASVLPPSINVGELFQKLVATGILPSVGAAEIKKEDESKQIKTVNFTPESLKVRQPGIVTRLYSGIQCSSCGVRFPPEQTMKYSQHLDWHFRQNRRERDSVKKAQSRKWYYDVSDWIQFEEIEDLEDRAQSWFETQVVEQKEEQEEIPSVPAAEKDNVCVVCHEAFEQFYNEETEEWHLRAAKRVDGKTYHPVCYDDYKASLEAAEEKEKIKEQEDNAKKAEADVKEETKEETVKEENMVKLKEEEPIKTDMEDGDQTPVKDEPPVAEVKTEPVSDIESEEVPVSEELTLVKEIKIEPAENEEKSDVKQENTNDEAATDLTTEDKADENPQPEDQDAGSVPVVDVIDNTQRVVTSSIDGNVEFDNEAPIAAPLMKIRFNISKPIPQPATTKRTESYSEGEADTSATEQETDTEVGENVGNPSEQMDEDAPPPPPPGEETLHLKPRLIGRKLQEMPPVMKGTELSGLCSIM